MTNARAKSISSPHAREPRVFVQKKVTTRPACSPAPSGLAFFPLFLLLLRSLQPSNNLGPRLTRLLCSSTVARTHSVSPSSSFSPKQYRHSRHECCKGHCQDIAHGGVHDRVCRLWWFPVSIDAIRYVPLHNLQLSSNCGELRLRALINRMRSEELTGSR